MELTMNRTGTYIAFDGLGKKDPSESDFKYYATLQAWNANKNIEFNITNSHDKASSVRDTSKRETLLASIQQRFRGSKNMLIVLSDDTRKSGSVLSDEIEMAVDTYKIPLIIAYVDYSVIASPHQLSKRWPIALQKRINDKTAHAIHIPFNKELVLKAITKYSPTQLPPYSMTIFIEKVYRELGLLNSSEVFCNK